MRIRPEVDRGVTVSFARATLHHYFGGGGLSPAPIMSGSRQLDPTGWRYAFGQASLALPAA
jgi:hypothetical protein